MTHHLLNYPERMRRNGYRVTPQRKIILDAICGAGRRIAIDEIVLRVRKKSRVLNRATVYRNLTFLQKMRLVDSTGSGKARKYEIASLEPHHHLLCRSCGFDIPLDRKTVDRLRAAIQRRHRFRIDIEHFTFPGLCGRCASAGRRKSNAPADGNRVSNA